MATREHRRKAAAQTGLYLVVVAGIVVFINLLSAGGYARLDTTKNERYTLSKGSGSLVSSLKGPLNVDAYVNTKLPKLKVFVQELTDLLKSYERAGGGKFKYTLIEPETDELRKQAEEAGLQPMAMGDQGEGGGDQIAIAQGYLGLVFKYGSEKEVIPQLSPQNSVGLEFWISNKIRELRDKADSIKHKVGVVIEKDELKLTDTNLLPRQGGGGGGPSFKSVLSQAFPFYELVDVNLADGASEIDNSLDGLIITQPGKPYSDRELRRIDQFLMRGNKALAVFASAVSIKPNDATMNATLDLHGLDKLLTGYGIQMKKDAVFDYGAQFRVPAMTAGGPVWIRHPGIVHVVADERFDEDKRLLDTGFPSFFRIEEMAFPFPSTLELLRDKQPADVTLKVLARTTENATGVEGDTVDMKIRRQWTPKPPYAQRAIAAAAEGKLKSAFGEGGDNLGVTANAVAPTPSRVMVISASQFLTNPFAYSGNGPELGGQFAMFGNVGGDQELLMFAGPYAQSYLTNTILSLKNTLDWISGDTDLLAASAKIIGFSNLTYSDIDPPKLSADATDEELRKKDEEYRQARKNQQFLVQWVLTLGLPLGVAAFGLLRWRSRQARKDQYKLSSVA